MTATNHALTGALIALVVETPGLAIPLAFVSHFVIDVIPHFGIPPGEFVFKKYTKYLVMDFVALIIVVISMALLFTDNFWIILACMAAAVAPDAAWWFYRRELESNNTKKLDFVSRFHL